LSHSFIAIEKRLSELERAVRDEKKEVDFKLKSDEMRINNLEDKTSNLEGKFEAYVIEIKRTFEIAMQGASESREKMHDKMEKLWGKLDDTKDAIRNWVVGFLISALLLAIGQVFYIKFHN